MSATTSDTSTIAIADASLSAQEAKLQAAINAHTVVVNNAVAVLTTVSDTHLATMAAMQSAVENSTAKLSAALSSLPPASSPTTGAGTAQPAVDANFPTDPGVAPFPSPENSRMIRNPDGSISGRPYLLDKNGSAHRLVPVTDGKGDGYTVNGNLTNKDNTDPSGVYAVLIVRQGQVYAQRAGGQWQWFNPAMGTIYNSGLPDAAGTSTAAPTATTAPTAPTPSAVAPGSSTKVLTVGAGATYATISAAIAAAQAGDTVAIGDGTYKEAPPCWSVPLKITMSKGALLDCTGLTDKLAHGKGAFVPDADSTLEGLNVTGVAMDQDTQSTAAIRPEAGCGYLTIVGGTLSKNQFGVAGGGVPTFIAITDTVFDNNGRGDGMSHDIYASGGIGRLTLTNVTATNPNGGHAVKSRAANTLITGGHLAATEATVVDVPDGSQAQCVISGVTLTKPAGSANHGVVGYAMESASNGAAGMLVKGCTIEGYCDSPLIQTSSGGSITMDASNKYLGTKPAAAGQVTGL